MKQHEKNCRQIKIDLISDMFRKDADKTFIDIRTANLSLYSGLFFFSQDELITHISFVVAME